MDAFFFSVTVCHAAVPRGSVCLNCVGSLQTYEAGRGRRPAVFRRAVNNFTAEVSADAVLNEDDNVSILIMIMWIFSGDACCELGFVYLLLCWTSNIFSFKLNTGPTVVSSSAVCGRYGNTGMTVLVVLCRVVQTKRNLLCISNRKSMWSQTLFEAGTVKNEKLLLTLCCVRLYLLLCKLRSNDSCWYRGEERRLRWLRWREIWGRIYQPLYPLCGMPCWLRCNLLYSLVIAFALKCCVCWGWATDWAVLFLAC